MVSDPKPDRRDLAAFLKQLNATKHTDAEQQRLWVEFLLKQLHEPDKAEKIVYDSVRKTRGVKEARQFAEKVRKDLLNRQWKKWSKDADRSNDKTS